MKVSRKNLNENFSLADVSTYSSGVLQSAVYRSLKKFTDTSLSEHGISTMQWFVIGTIHDAGATGIRITDLAKQVGTTLSFLTNMVNALEAKDILTRVVHNEDNRAKWVRITDYFEPKVLEIETDLRIKMRATIYKKITPEELLTYIRVLRKLSDVS